MSGALPSQDSKQARYLRSDEKDLIRKALGPKVHANLDDLRVLNADDGGMGGVRFEADQASRRVFGWELARLNYVDADGVPVSITINSDMHGDLFEIDFWKVDFSPLIAYPRIDQLEKHDVK